METTEITSALAVDIAIGLAILVFAIIKGRKGLYATLVPFVVALLALAGASFTAELLTEPISRPLIPIAAERIAEKIDPSEMLGAKTDTSSDSSGAYLDAIKEHIPEELQRIIDLDGIEDSLTDFIGGLRGKAQVKTEELVREAAEAMAKELVPRYVHLALFIISLIVLWFLLTALSKALGITFKLPILSAVNTLGGAAVGIIECGIIIAVILWAADQLGISFFRDLEPQSLLLKYFFIPN